MDEYDGVELSGNFGGSNTFENVDDFNTSKRKNKEYDLFNVQTNEKVDDLFVCNDQINVNVSNNENEILSDHNNTTESLSLDSITSNYSTSDSFNVEENLFSIACANARAQ